MEARKRSKAGAYAWRQHLKGMLPWFLPVLAPSILLPFFFLAYLVPGRVDLATSLLVTVPLLALALVSLKATDKVNDSWGEGARGEFRVGAELEKLHKDGYYVFHDWQKERSNVDHFVVGPQGVFAVETKATTGEITSERGKLRKDNKPFSKDPVGQAKGNARDVNGLISDSGNRAPWVHPILCFSRADVRCYGPVNSVEVTNPGSLRRAIVNCPGRHSPFSPQKVEEISRALAEYLKVEPAAQPDLPPEKSAGRLRKALRADRAFVAVYALFLLALSVVFASSTARIFEFLAAFYRLLETAISSLL